MTSRDSAVDAVSAEVERYWRLFCANTGTDVESRYIARIFGDPEIGVDIIDALVSAVKGGRKRGTTPCKVNLDHNNRSVPEVGDYWIVLDSRGLPACVVRVTKVEHARFDEVDEEWAATEGEADSSLEYWYAMHRWWFQKCYRKWGVPWEEEAPIVKICFERVPETANIGSSSDD